MKHTILLTGATGTIGGRILKELVEGTDATFKLLVHGQDDAAARDKVARVLSFWGLAPGDPALATRLEILRGDIRDPGLGLDKAAYARVGGGVTHAIHCAADIRLDRSLEEARESILGGTRYVVELCRLSARRGTFRRFNHFSTMEVAGDLSGVVKEEFLTGVKRRFLNAYEQAKAETEDYLDGLHREEGFPVTIYRPSMVVGDSETGQALKFGSFYHLLDDFFLHPRSPFMPGHDAFMIDTIPVDVIAKAVRFLYDREDSDGRVYHLASGPGRVLTLPEFAGRLGAALRAQTGKAFRRPRFVSPRLVWILNQVAYPFVPGKMRRRIVINLIFLKFFFLRACFDNARTQAFLAGQGVAIPGLEQYLPALVKYYLEHHAQGREAHDRKVPCPTSSPAWRTSRASRNGTPRLSSGAGG